MSANGSHAALNAPRTQTDRRDELLVREEQKARRRRRWALRRSFLKRFLQFALIAGFVLGFIWIFRHRMLVNVESGEIMVLYYRFLGGTSHNTIGHEGLHIIAPWDKAYLYQTRTQTLVVPMTVLSKNGLEVHLDAQIRFHPVPELLPYMHRRYGPDYVKTIVVPQLTEAVQSVIGQFLPEDIYSSSTGATADRLFDNAKRIIGGVFVEVEDIALFNIRLPARVQEAIQSKAEQQQIAQAYEFVVQKEQEEVQRRQLEVQGLKLYTDMAKGIPQSVLVLKGIEATLELAKSPNTKVIVFGSKDSLPLVLGNVPDLAQK